MAEIDKGLMMFLMQYPEGHVDNNSESMLQELNQRFKNTSFVNEYKKRIEGATSEIGKSVIVDTLMEIVNVAENNADLSTLIPVLDIVADIEFCRGHGIKPIEISQRNLIIANILMKHGRADLAESFIPGISEVPPKHELN